MPNWCANTLYVLGSEHCITSFLAKGIAENTSEETIFHEEFKGRVDKQTAETVLARFMSRYEPPLDFLREMSKWFPSLMFHLIWSEPGCGSFGHAVIADGTTTTVEMGKELHEAMSKMWQLFDRRFGDNWKVKSAEVSNAVWESGYRFDEWAEATLHKVVRELFRLTSSSATDSKEVVR